MIIIHPEAEQHTEGVYRVEELAFRRAGEADLCVKLRERGAVTLSLVALDDGEVVGHVLFSPVTIRGDGEPLNAVGTASRSLAPLDAVGTAGRSLAPLDAVGMGPVAVLPDRQRQGIGSRLIRAGLEEVRQLGHAAVVVLGDPRYYSRFGFEPASRYGVRFQDPNVPAEDFMLMELRRGALQGHAGVAFYEPEFMDV